MSRLRAQDGYTLMELLAAMTLLIVVLGATLTTFEGFYKRENRNQAQQDAQDTARNAMDKLARQLRNLASPTTANVKSIDKATDYDLVFQTVDPTKRRVRYCLDTSNPSNEKLWMQAQSFGTDQTDPGPPPTSSCPAPVTAPTIPPTATWATQQLVADHVVNKLPGDRDVFYFNWPSGSTDTSKITHVGAEVFVDTTPGRAPAEATLDTGVFLRNQNQLPTASFSITPSPPNTRNFIFNGSDSSDPEGRTLDYSWFTSTSQATLSSASQLPDCVTVTSANGFTCIGHGITQDYTFPASWATGSKPWVTLRVVDPGGLIDIQSTQITPGLP